MGVNPTYDVLSINAVKQTEFCCCCLYNNGQNVQLQYYRDQNVQPVNVCSAFVMITLQGEEINQSKTFQTCV